MTTCPNCGHELAPKPLPLTPRELHILEFICRTIKEEGVAPTYRIMAKELGTNSLGGVFCVVQRLAGKGWVKHHRYIFRGIEVLHYPNGAA